jgi:hypothetical protein
VNLVNVARAGALVALLLAISGPLAACSSAGDTGKDCVDNGGLLNASYSCSAGLTCNTGESPPLCEAPNAQGKGGPCGADDNCVSGLFCNVEGACAVLLGVGETCPSGIGCGPDLTCEKATTTCVAADAGYLEAGAPDSTTTSDAMPAAVDAAGDAEGGGDASESGGDASSDAAPLDGQGTDAMACGWIDDAGEHSGACAAGSRCCSGGAVDTFYCHSGTGSCPAVP